jgi:hypothetical protein
MGDIRMKSRERVEKKRERTTGAKRSYTGRDKEQSQHRKKKGRG